MCEKCDMRLLSASQAALNLATAAQVLDSINQKNESKVLAKAAADLFETVEVTGEVPTQAQTATAPDQSEQSIKVDEATGDVFLHGVRVGRAVLVRRT